MNPSEYKKLLSEQIVDFKGIPANMVDYDIDNTGFKIQHYAQFSEVQKTLMHTLLDGINFLKKDENREVSEIVLSKENFKELEHEFNSFGGSIACCGHTGLNLNGVQVILSKYLQSDQIIYKYFKNGHNFLEEFKVVDHFNCRCFADPCPAKQLLEDASTNFFRRITLGDE